MPPLSPTPQLELTLQRRMAFASTLDLESPLSKVLRFLTSISEGRRKNRGPEARDLCETLSVAESLNTPDLANQLRDNEDFNPEIAQFLIENTTVSKRHDARKLGDSASEKDRESRHQTTESSSKADSVEMFMTLTPAEGLPTTETITNVKLRMADTFARLGLDASLYGQGSDIDHHFDSVVLPEEEQDVYPWLPNSPDYCETPITHFGNSLGMQLNRLGQDFFFDAFAFEQACEGRPLTVAMMFFFHKFDLISSFALNIPKLESYLLVLESGHSSSNPFHCAARAADCLQRVGVLLEHCVGVGRGVTPLQAMACLLAVAVQDYMHPGTSNQIQILRGSEVAVEYNDQHVLENKSTCLALTLLAQSEYDFFGNMDDAQKRQVRGHVISMVLATDLSLHFDLLTKFQSKFTSPDLVSAALLEPPAVTLLLQIIVKIASLGHHACGRSLHLDWLECLEEEYFKQGDCERSLGVKVSALMDRHEPGPTHPRAQLLFLDVIVIPTFTAFGKVFGGFHSVTDQLSSIRRFWVRREGQPRVNIQIDDSAT